MKIQTSATNQSRQAAALIFTVIILAFVAFFLVSYLAIVQNEYTAVSRSQNWNSSMVLTEAGVEDALAFMNKYQGNFPMVTNWSTAASAAADGWTKTGNVFYRTNVVNTNTGYYSVTIDNSSPSSPVITSAGAAYWNFSAASSPLMVAVAGVSASTAAPVLRKVQVTAIYSALFPGAITTVTNIDFNGNNVAVDSYDSTTNAYSTWTTNGFGTYPTGISAKIRGNGNVATDSSVLGAISGGNANIYGHLDTGPGGTATFQNNGYAGPWPQVSGTSGIQPGYSASDMNVIFPDVTLPSGAAGWRSISGNTTITNAGNYSISTLNSDLTINANATIYVSGSADLKNHTLTVGANVTSVVIYIAGPSFTLSGNGTINNLTGHPVVLQVYGLPTLTSIDFQGNAAFVGTIYAPEADFKFGGGGNNTEDFIGALVARSCTLNGKANFHYDESLKVSGPGIGYIPSKWGEIKPGG